MTELLALAEKVAMAVSKKGINECPIDTALSGLTDGQKLRAGHTA